MPYYERHFTVAEARALLPELRRAFAHINTLMEELQRRRCEDSEKVQFFSANGKGPRIEGGEERTRAEVQQILDGIHAKGVQVKDMRRGLCDFPYLMPPANQEVFLCWELCDSDMSYWHTLEGGFGDRIRLEETKGMHGGEDAARR